MTIGVFLSFVSTTIPFKYPAITFFGDQEIYVPVNIKISHDTATLKVFLEWTQIYELFKRKSHQIKHIGSAVVRTMHTD